MKYLNLILCALILSGCAAKYPSKGEQFPGMYEERPVCILVAPPMNQTTAAEAKDYYATTIQEPMVLAGYYVLPYEVTTEMLKREGLYESELYTQISLRKFQEYFGADAILFTTIKKWDITYLVLASKLTVSIDCALKSTKTERTLWAYNGTIEVDLSQNQNQTNLAGLITQVAATAIRTARADYVPYAKKATAAAVTTLPFGKYHSKYLQDMGDPIVASGVSYLR